MRKRPLVLLVVCAASGCAATDTHSDAALAALGSDRPYDFHRAMAVSLLRTGQPSSALNHVNLLLKAEPEEAEPHLLKGTVLVELGHYQEAEKSLLVAAELDPELASVQALLGVVLDSMGDHVAAERAHREAIRLATDQASYYNNLGFGLYLQARYRASIEALGKAIERDPTNPKIHNNLGFAYAALDDLDLAYRHFRLAGGTAFAENNIGFVLERQGDKAGACERYARAVVEDPELNIAKTNLGRLCVPVGGAE